MVRAPAEGKNAAGQLTEATLPRQLVARAFCARRFFLLPGCHLCRTNGRGDSAKRVFLCLKGRSRNRENQGDSAEIGTSLNHIAASGRRFLSRKKCNRANDRRHLFRVSRARWRFFSARVANYAKEITEASLSTWRPVRFPCRCWYYLRLLGQFRRRINPGGSDKMALRSDFLSATGLVSFVVNSA